MQSSPQDKSASLVMRNSRGFSFFTSVCMLDNKFRLILGSLQFLVNVLNLLESQGPPVWTIGLEVAISMALEAFLSFHKTSGPRRRRHNKSLPFVSSGCRRELGCLTRFGCGRLKRR